jgi:hypothetical protein
MPDHEVTVRAAEAVVHLAAERLAALTFVVIGLSHVLQPRAWAEFFVLLRSKGAAGNFANAFLSLTIGTLIVGFHNVWSGPAAVLTVVGWGQVFKGALYFCVPAWGLRGLARVSPERPAPFAAAGVVLIALGGVVGWVAVA